MQDDGPPSRSSLSGPCRPVEVHAPDVGRRAMSDDRRRPHTRPMQTARTSPRRWHGAPLIAVTTSEVRIAALDTPAEQGDPPREEMALGLRYLQAVERAGGIPVAVTPLGAPALEALLDRVDGICLSGGPDIHPS